MFFNYLYKIDQVLTILCNNVKHGYLITIHVSIFIHFLLHVVFSVMEFICAFISINFYHFTLQIETFQVAYMVPRYVLHTV
jgi:hypothetical protein